MLWKTSHDVWTSNWHSGDRVVLSVWNIVVQRQKDGPTTWTNSGLLRVEPETGVVPESENVTWPQGTQD